MRTKSITVQYVGSVSELLFESPSALAARVRAGELTARELVETSLRRIDELQPTINAFTHVAHDAALAAADEIAAGDPRPFAGVPIAIKDNRPVAGMPLTMCSDLWNITPGHDAFLVRRLREAGFVIVGKTALPEMGILPTTESRRFGPTRNPWDLGSDPGRLERRVGGRRGRRHGPGGARQRRRRLDPDPRLLLRPRGAQAGAGAGVGRARRRPELPGLRRRAHAHGGGYGRDPRRARRLRARRRHLGAARRRRRTRSWPSTTPGRLRIGAGARLAAQRTRRSIRRASRRRATRRR